MWTVLYRRHFVYIPYKDLRYETARWYIAFVVYQWWYFRYVMSVYPVKSIKTYKVQNNVVNLNSYSKSSLGDYAKFRRKRVRGRNDL